MDAHGFDTLTRNLTTAVTRRRGLRGLAGAALAVVTGQAVTALPAAARPGGICHALGHACNDGQVPCCGKTVCKGRRCQCRGGRTACGKRCIDTKRHDQHCGRCGNRCDNGEQCRNGKCQPSDGGGGGVGGAQCTALLLASGCTQRGGNGPVQCVGVNLSGANLTNCNLSGAIMTDTACADCKLDGVNFSNAQMNNFDCRSSTMKRVILRGAFMQEIDFGGCDMTDASFLNAEVTANSFMVETNLQGADLTNAKITRTQLEQANMLGASVDGADFWAFWGNTICPNGENSNNTGGSCCDQFGEFIVNDCDNWNGSN